MPRLIVVSLIAFLFPLFAACGPTPTSPAQDSGMALVMCEEVVRERLTSPSTAKFPYADQVITPIDQAAGRYRVTGVVDAQNALGATVRGDYACIIHYDPTDGAWVLDDLTID